MKTDTLKTCPASCLDFVGNALIGFAASAFGRRGGWGLVLGTPAAEREDNTTRGAGRLGLSHPCWLPASTRLELPRRCHALTGTRLTLSRSCLESDSFAVKERGRNHFSISRRALAPVWMTQTGASALRLIAACFTSGRCSTSQASLARQASIAGMTISDARFTACDSPIPHLDATQLPHRVKQVFGASLLPPASAPRIPHDRRRRGG